MLIPERRKKRYICTFVKKNEKGELKGNVVVIAAHNELLAQAELCERYNVPPVSVKRINFDEYDKEGVRMVRLAETNVYEGDSSNENFRSDS